MNRQEQSVTLVGLRIPSVLGFIFIILPGIVLVALGFLMLKPPTIASSCVVAVLGICLIVYSLDFLARSIKPNRLVLGFNGFRLETWRRTTEWPWRNYRGVWGTGHLMLKVAMDRGQSRNIPIGHWSRDLEYRLYTYATCSGVDVPKPLQLRPSLAPLFFLSGAFMIVAVVVAYVGLRK